MDHTYTFTRYFSEEDLEPLGQAVLGLLEDLDKRRPFVSEAAYEAMRGRLAILEEATRLLDEPVPRSFGG